MISRNDYLKAVNTYHDSKKIIENYYYQLKNEIKEVENLKEKTLSDNFVEITPETKLIDLLRNPLPCRTYNALKYFFSDEHKVNELTVKTLLKLDLNKFSKKANVGKQSIKDIEFLLKSSGLK
jgi:hypothetical protein